MKDPWRYYENNVAGTLNLMQAMQKNGCKKVRRDFHVSFYIKLTRLLFSLEDTGPIAFCLHIKFELEVFYCRLLQGT